MLVELKLTLDLDNRINAENSAVVCDCALLNVEQPRNAAESVIVHKLGKQAAVHFADFATRAMLNTRDTTLHADYAKLQTLLVAISLGNME